MRLRVHHERPPREPAIPLINVVFLLLVFLMLTTSIEPVDPLPVELAVSDADELPVRAARVTLDAGGRLALDDRDLDRAALLAALAEMRPPRVALRADGRVPARTIIALARDIAATGAGTVELAVRRR